MTRLVILIIFILALIAIASSIPNLRFASSEVLDVAIRKPGHVLAYGALGYLLGQIITRGRSQPTARIWPWIAVVAIIAIAIADELNQRMVVGRQPSVLDVVLDAAGGCIGLFLALGVRRVWHRPPS